ncbi:MAG: hypothetical protein JNM27_03380 [Leptospirales bacterium]|nr:hypothetical protein [Leptospirales bacterium]
MAILYNNWGHAFSNPTPAQLAEAIRQLLAPDGQIASNADYREHPEAWIEALDIRKRLWAVTASRNGYLHLTVYSDADMETELLAVSRENAAANEIASAWNALLEQNLTALLRIFNARGIFP